MQHQLADFENAKAIVPRMIDFVVELPLKYPPLQKEEKKTKKKKDPQDAAAAAPSPPQTAAESATPTATAPIPPQTPESASVSTAASAPAPAPQKEDKKKKKEQQPQPQQPKKKDAADISILDIRVGKIVTVKKHDNADSLYVEDIDVGEEKPRVVCSGLVNFIPIDRMQDRVVLVCCNLKETNMRGVVSQAMVMAASTDDHSVVELVSVPDGAKIGEQIQFSGYEGPKGANLTRKQLEVVLPDLKTTAEGLCVYKEAAFMTSAGPCTSTLLSAHIG